MEYRHLLAGNDMIVSKGFNIVKDIELPSGYMFSDSFLYQIGMGEKTLSDAHALAKELYIHSVRNCVHK